MPILPTIAAKLDASPRVVWNWRDLWRTTYVQINAFGAVLSFVIGTLLWIAPLLGVVWASSMLSLKVALTLTFILFAGALIARYTTQPKIPNATPPTKEE